MIVVVAWQWIWQGFHTDLRSRYQRILCSLMVYKMIRWLLEMNNVLSVRNTPENTRGTPFSIVTHTQKTTLSPNSTGEIYLPSVLLLLMFYGSRKKLTDHERRQVIFSLVFCPKKTYVNAMWRTWDWLLSLCFYQFFFPRTHWVIFPI